MISYSLFVYLFFFFNDTAPTEIYTSLFVGSVRVYKRQEVGDEEYEYTVKFSALQDIDRTNDSKEKHAKYHISATVNPDGLISAMSMTKILE